MDFLKFFDELAESLGDGYVYKGNSEQLEILQTAISRRDASVWNDFISRQHESFVAHLAGARLRVADLRFVNLRNANLEDVDLRQAILVFSHLDGARLSGVNFLGADLGGSSLVGADLR